MPDQFISSPLSEVHNVQSMFDDINGTDGCYQASYNFTFNNSINYIMRRTLGDCLQHASGPHRMYLSSNMH